MNEIEVKILDINPHQILEQFESYGYSIPSKEKVSVWWYARPEDRDGPWPWYLRIRSYGERKHEVTWKPHEKVVDNVRVLQEINFDSSSAEETKHLFEALDLVQYGFQEKFRTSWEYQDWKFDLDEYPGVPPLIEIEGKSATHVQEAISFLRLQDKQTWARGERLMVEEVYKRNWFDMRF